MLEYLWTVLAGPVIIGLVVAFLIHQGIGLIAVMLIRDEAKFKGFRENYTAAVFIFKDVAVLWAIGTFIQIVVKP